MSFSLSPHIDISSMSCERLLEYSQIVSFVFDVYHQLLPEGAPCGAWCNPAELSSLSISLVVSSSGSHEHTHRLTHSHTHRLTGVWRTSVPWKTFRGLGVIFNFIGKWEKEGLKQYGVLIASDPASNMKRLTCRGGEGLAEGTATPSQENRQKMFTKVTSLSICKQT